MTNIDNIEIQIENVQPKKRKTYVAFVLDESSSMGSMNKQAISLFNENLDTLKIEGEKNNIENIVTIIKFSSDTEIVCENVPVRNVEKINKGTYNPSGMTALYDGIGLAINTFKKVKDYDDVDISFLILVITDGEENNSKEFRGESLSAFIKDLQESNRWTFTVLGANIDLQKLSRTIGISPSNVQNLNFTPQGFAEGSQDMTRGIRSYSSARSAGIGAVNNFYVDPNQDLQYRPDTESSDSPALSPPTIIPLDTNPNINNPIFNSPNFNPPNIVIPNVGIQNIIVDYTEPIVGPIVTKEQILESYNKIKNAGYLDCGNYSLDGDKNDNIGD